MVKRLIHKINVRFNEHAEHVIVRRKLITFSDNPDVL